MANTSNIIIIQPNECLGNSLVSINNNFKTLNYAITQAVKTANNVAKNLQLAQKNIDYLKNKYKIQ